MKTLEKRMDTLNCALTMIMCVLIGFAIAFMFFTIKYEKAYRERPTVEQQHQSLMLDGDYIYCPYCGEKLEVKK